MNKKYELTSKKISVNSIGVIIGRFQTPKLHKGHIHLFNEVKKNHKKIIVMIGYTIDVIGTKRNPLDFLSRKKMIQDRYNDSTIIPLPDNPCDKQWSINIDKKIKEIAGVYSDAYLYGSRDSFISSYKGVFNTVKVQDIKGFSGTVQRQMASELIPDSTDFRNGIIYSSINRYTAVFQCVDCIVRKDGQLLLGRKKGLSKYCFIGGFVDENDDSMEYAASRELSEETGHSISVMNQQYLGSCKIDDWRYKNEKESIMTSVFLFSYLSGKAVACDDLNEVKWVNEYNVKEILQESHYPILDMYIKNKLSGEKTC